MAVDKTCLVCGNYFSVGKARENTAKYCSRKCSDNKPHVKNYVNCKMCGIKFPLKKSQAEKSKNSFCGKQCKASYFSQYYQGERNPNYKGKNRDQDGYVIGSFHKNGTRVKLHRANSLEASGLNKIPDGMQVHHKDCDRTNNDPSNLAFMTRSDHNWLHKQFGNATLWAYENGKISLSDLESWSDNPDRARRLLISSVELQGTAAKMLCEKYGFDVNKAINYMTPIKVELEEVTELKQTKRGEKGFGSTGR